MRPLCFALLFSSLAGQPNEAENLFRDMEKKVLAAKVFSVTGAMQVDGSKGDKSKVEVSLLLGKGNKARVQATTHVRGETRPLKMVSDGARMQLTLAAGQKPKEQPTPGQLHRALALRFSRLGLSAGLYPFRRPPSSMDKEVNLDQQIRLSDFTEGKAEKVEEREARVIRYQVSRPNNAGRIAVTLWLDARTHLPLKRVLNFERTKARVEDTYKEFHLDPKVDAKHFELPR